MSKKVAIFLAEGFEEIEALSTADILVRAGFNCNLVSTMGEGTVRGTHGVVVETDTRLEDIDESDYDMIVLPGGLPGADNLRDNPGIIAIVKAFAETGDKFVAAICAAPEVLAAADIVRGKKVTSYPSNTFREILEVAGAEYLEERVVVDGNVITSRGPGTTFEFAFTLVEALGGEARTLKEAMLVR